MISIFSAQKLTSRPYLAIDTIRFEIFRRLDPNKFIYWTDVEDDSLIQGCIKKIPCKFKNKYLRFLERIYWMRKIKPDFLLVIGAHLDFLFCLFKPQKTKILVHLNGPIPSINPFSYYFFPLLRLSFVFILKRAHLIITVSEYVKNSIVHLVNSKKIFVIYNGVDTQFFNPNKRDRDCLRKKYNIPSGKPLITFIGVLIKRKRPDLIIKLAKLHHNKIFIIVGRETKQLHFKKLIKNVDNIIWIPIMERKDIACLLASSDVFLLPSLYEGFGLVVIEAMACGCPVIVTDHGSLSELIINNFDGFKIPQNENEIKLFSQFIDFLLQNKSLRTRIIHNAFNKVEKNFSWDRISLEWEKILMRII
jgi:glycosyltransferase involved in cell wall biosynthesis